MPSNSKRPMAPPANARRQNSATSSTKNPSLKSVPQNSTASATTPSGTASAQASRTSSPANAEIPGSPSNPTTVNRKKQKRRQKQAARLAAEQQSTDTSNVPTQNGAGSHEHDAGMQRQYMDYDPDDMDDTDDEAHYSTHAHDHLGSNGMQQESAKRKGKKKKNRKSRSQSHHAEESSTSLSTPSASLARPVALPPLPSAAYRSAHKVTKDRIWNTSTHEERERIKEFWLQLGEEERRSLVKVEKEAVLRKMKEQQKHSCSCTVCGRKRTAIEEELEVLYDAYYEELEQYANHKQGSFEDAAPIGAPPRMYQSPLRSVDRSHHHPAARPPSRGRVQELPDEEDDLEDDYDEDEDDDEGYSEDELEDPARSTRADFFAFGNSLTVKDGILTVADDLLKNDGKHFIDMMEQLAERRMQREEDTQYAAASAAHQPMHGGHNHAPPLDEEEYDEEEEEDYDSQEDEEYEEDEMDAMTEEQRMEEGRRMFQIFAARMFEQRVLTAYREKIARERQDRLIQELEEENRLDVEREAKKAREAQKKKDKKRLQKQAKEEEKAKRDAERAAEEAAQKAAEEKRQEEQRRKKEEQRRKREAEKKAQEEERQRKEAERQKRLKEERERQAELERKQREQKERERKVREEAKKKEREEKEAKERILREKKAKEERERKERREREEREEKARREKEAAAKAEREAKERAKREEQAAQQAAQQAAAQAAAVQAAKRASQPAPAHLPPGLQHPQGSSALHAQSPHFQVATPVVPKAPTPMRPRQTSQQGSHASSPRSQAAHIDHAFSLSPGAVHSAHTPVSSSFAPGKGMSQTPLLQHPQLSAPHSPLGNNVGRSPHPPGFNAMLSMNGLTSSTSGIASMGHRLPIGSETSPYSNTSGPIGGQYRGFNSSDVPLPPGLNAPRPLGQGRGFSMDAGQSPVQFNQQTGGAGVMSAAQSQPPQSSGAPFAHARQPSVTDDRNPLQPSLPTQPISRPGPIGGTATQELPKETRRLQPDEVDELSTQLGSSALLDDDELPLFPAPSQPLSSSAIPLAPPGGGRTGFGSSSLFSDPLYSSKSPFSLATPTSGVGSGWASHNPFGPPGFPSLSSWGSSQGSNWPSGAFGMGMLGGSHRAHTSRPVAIRLSVIQACQKLDEKNGHLNPEFHSVNEILRYIEDSQSPTDVPITLDEMLDICDTEGNSQNGGGSFSSKSEGHRGTFVKFEPDSTSNATTNSRRSIVPGDIGSPIPGSSLPAAPGSGSRQFISTKTGL